MTRFIRTHRRHSAVAGVIVLALAAGGVAYAVTSSGGSSSTATPPTTSAPTTTPKAPKARSNGHKALRGQLTAMAPGSWTMQTAAGQTIVVTMNAQTLFGSKKAPSTPSAFKVGDRIVVTGTRSATSVVATKIALGQAPAAAPAAGATTTTTAPATAAAG